MSETERLAVRDPFADGVKVIENVQLASACTFEPQVVVSAKSAALVPVNEILVMLNVLCATLVSVTFFTALLVPTVTLPKLRDLGES